MGNVNYYGKVWVLVSSTGKVSTTIKKKLVKSLTVE